MTNMPKRQKTLLGYFTLSESGKKDRCQDGQVCKAQAQDSLTGAVKAGPGTTHPSTQRAATSDREALTDSMGNESALAQLDNQDGMMTVKSQQIIGPFSQLESDTGQHSSMGCRVSEGNAAADCTECSTASDNETDEANQYEQQVQRPHVDWLAKPCNTAANILWQQSRGKSTSVATMSACEVLDSIS